MRSVQGRFPMPSIGPRMLALLALSTPIPAAGAPVTVVKAGLLIDGSGGAPLRNAVVLIEGERIRAVGAGLELPTRARGFVLSGSTALPGLSDAHTHIGAPVVGAPGWGEPLGHETAVRAFLRRGF